MYYLCDMIYIYIYIYIYLAESSIYIYIYIYARLFHVLNGVWLDILKTKFADMENVDSKIINKSFVSYFE